MAQKIIVDVTPEYLIGLYNDHTNVQADQLAQPYIGKWIRFSGAVRNIHKSPNMSISLVAMFDDYYQLYMDFSKEWTERLVVIRRGQAITVLGKITRITSTQVELGNCELIEGDRNANTPQ